MDRIIRVGIPRDKLAARKAAMAMRYIRRHDMPVKMRRLLLDKSIDNDIESLTRQLTGNRIDLAVVEYTELAGYVEQAGYAEQKGQEDVLNGSGYIIGLVCPQADDRDVIVTRKRDRNTFCHAVVECYSDASRRYMEATYEDVICKGSSLGEAMLLQRVESGQCDAAVVSADRLRGLGLDRERGLAYTFFVNTYDKRPKALWVGLIRSDDAALAELLMPMSDGSALQKLAKCDKK